MSNSNQHQHQHRQHHHSHSADQSRTLLPASPQETSLPTLPSPPEPIVTSPQSLWQEASDGKRKRSQISVACEVCRRRKAKCDGVRPVCGPCHARGPTDCKYIADPDATRMTTLKRKYEALSQSKRQLEDLYDLLRLRSPDEADEILRRIRSGGSLIQILQTAQDGTLLDDSEGDKAAETEDVPLLSAAGASIPELRARHAKAYYKFHTPRPPLSVLSVRDRMRVDSLLATPLSPSPTSPEPNISDSQSYDSSSHTPRQQETWASYVDPMLTGARLAKWTDVTKDNEFLAHLVSIFFAFESPQWMFCDKDLFMTDLINNTTTYCSSMLFNSICAYACHISPRLSKRSEVWDPNNIGSSFSRAGQRQFDTRTEEDDFITVQTGLLLTITAMLDVQAPAGVTLCRATIETAHGLGFYDSATVYKAKRGATDVQVRHVCELTAWALYNYVTFIHFAMRKVPPLRRPPPFPPPVSPMTDLSSIEVFEGYPLQPDIMNGFAQASFRAYCALTPIQSQIVYKLFGGDARQPRKCLTPAVAATSLEKLYDWAENLVPATTPRSKCPPHVLVLHMVLHSIIIDLLYPFRDNGDCIIPIKGLSHEGCTVRDLVQASRKQLVSALEQLKYTHGIERGPFIILQTFFISMVDMRRHIHEPDTGRYFLSIVQAARKISESYDGERFVLRDLRETLRREKILLSKEILDCITFEEDSAIDGDSGSLQGQAESSPWESLDTRGRVAIMETLVDALSLNDKVAGKTREKSRP